MSLILLLGTASAINKARKGQWYAAAGILLPVLGMDVMLLGALERDGSFLFWLGVCLSLVGFGMEFVASRRPSPSAAA